MQSEFWTNVDQFECIDVSRLFKRMTAWDSEKLCGIYVAGIAYLDEDEHSDNRTHQLGSAYGYRPDSNPFAKKMEDLDYGGVRPFYAFEMIPLYVGMTTRPFRDRIRDHHILQPLVELPWIELRCWPFPLGTPKEYLMELEAIVIDNLKPPLNKVRTATTPLLAPTPEDDYAN